MHFMRVLIFIHRMHFVGFSLFWSIVLRIYTHNDYTMQFGKHNSRLCKYWNACYKNELDRNHGLTLSSNFVENSPILFLFLNICTNHYYRSTFDHFNYDHVLVKFIYYFISSVCMYQCQSIETKTNKTKKGFNWRWYIFIKKRTLFLRNSTLDNFQ